MAQPIGPANDSPDSANRRGPSEPKKKGCKTSKCSNWKGGKCRCGKA
ncbi:MULTISPECIES: hypothetical protein [unclassified Cyanobium]|jgi:hypothetical protein|nr:MULTISPECIES: hypothetical protein [unclassified Cyanobium]MBE9154687.1 hypothetical protein [Cyanobium sp. LEGE 06113]QNI70065.1 hypothetical protein CyaNS01_00927 [Cyanobium sp. NS01]